MSINGLFGKILSYNSKDETNGIGKLGFLDITTMKELTLSQLFKPGFDYKKIFADYLAKQPYINPTYDDIAKAEKVLQAEINTYELCVIIPSTIVHTEPIRFSIPCDLLIDQMNL